MQGHGELGGWEVQSDFSPDLLQLIDGRTAAVVAAEGGDGAVEEGGEGHHQVEGQRGRVLGQRYLQLDRLHILLVVISPVSQLSLPETQTFLQQSWNIKLVSGSSVSSLT